MIALPRVARAIVVALCATAITTCPSPTLAPAPAREPPAGAPAPAPVAAESSGVDLRALMTPVKDQGDRLACAHFAVAAELEALLKARAGRDVDLSEEYLVVAEKALGSSKQSEIASPGDVYTAVRRCGLVLEEDWAYQPSWFARGLPGAAWKSDDPTAPAECFSHREPPPGILAKRLAVTVRSVQVRNGIAGALDLLCLGRPLVTYFRLPALPDESGVDPPGWPASGDVSWDDALEARYPDAPFHFVLVTGYDLERRVLFIKNSWGTSWGHGGYGTVPFGLVERVDPFFYFTRAADVGVLPAPDRPAPLVTDLVATCAWRPDGGLDVRVTGRADHVAGRHVAVRGELRAGSDALVLPDADCAAFLPFTRRARGGQRSLSAVWHHIPTDEDTLSWVDDAPVRLDLPPELLRAVAGTTREPLVVRVALLVHTDVEGYRSITWIDVSVPTDIHTRSRVSRQG